MAKTSAALLVTILAQFYYPLVNGRLFEAKCAEYAKINGLGKCRSVPLPLIVGGTMAQEKEFPHMAVIGFGASPESELAWECGGALISEKFVLTASHCSYSREKGAAQKVKLGAINLKSLGHGLQERIIKEFIKHPSFKPPAKYNDIALVRLASPVQFTPYVIPACLSALNIETDKHPVATGFGKLGYDYGNQGSPNLMKVQLDIISNQICKKLLVRNAKNVLPYGLRESIICAGALEGGRDTCQGDSGGPLQILTKEPYCVHRIVGVTSFGKFCGFRNSPAIYTRVSSYIPWIEHIVWRRQYVKAVRIFEKI